MHTIHADHPGLSGLSSLFIPTTVLAIFPASTFHVTSAWFQHSAITLGACKTNSQRSSASILVFCGFPNFISHLALLSFLTFTQSAGSFFAELGPSVCISFGMSRRIRRRRLAHDVGVFMAPECGGVVRFRFPGRQREQCLGYLEN